MAVNFAKLFLTIKNEVRGVAPDLVLISIKECLFLKYYYQ